MYAYIYIHISAFVHTCMCPFRFTFEFISVFVHLSSLTTITMRIPIKCFRENASCRGSKLPPLVPLLAPSHHLLVHHPDAVVVDLPRSSETNILGSPCTLLMDLSCWPSGLRLMESWVSQPAVGVASKNGPRSFSMGRPALGRCAHEVLLLLTPLFRHAHTSDPKLEDLNTSTLNPAAQPSCSTADMSR